MTLSVILSWAFAMAALSYAAETGASWPLPFALLVVVIGGALHLTSERNRDR